MNLLTAIREGGVLASDERRTDVDLVLPEVPVPGAHVIASALATWKLVSLERVGHADDGLPLYLCTYRQVDTRNLKGRRLTPILDRRSLAHGTEARNLGIA